MNHSFDYIIVGSGPAGSILANRLTQDKLHTACVIEAGIPDTSMYIRIPAGFVKTLYDPSFLWSYETEPSDSINGRSINLPQGKLVGGSSSINGLVYSRGQPEDFDDWAQMGNVGWAYKDILPYFKRTEKRIGPADENVRGRNGELPITNPDWKSKLCESYIQGAMDHGIPRNQDFNGVVHDGVGYFQRYIYKGKRVSCADAFLHPAIKRGGVELQVNARVQKILFEETRAVGVRYLQDGVIHDVMANKEVIICAGTLNSPQILQHSGIGDSTDLQALGIPVTHHLPGVGKNLRDHFTVRLVARAKNAASINELSRGWRLGIEISKWLLGLPSILALSPSMVHVCWKSKPELTRGDIQVLFTPASYKSGKNYELDDFPGMSCGVRQQRPNSSGTLRLRSANVNDKPIIQPNYLTDEVDQQVMVAGIKIARELMASASLAPHFHSELVPGSHCMSDEALLDFARTRGSTSYHLVGTCKMGTTNDSMAVVDSQLRVYGIQNLRVVDASVMPQVPSANTLAATTMVAEKAADMIKGKLHYS